MQDPQLTSFGIHNATFKDNLDPDFWGIAKILGSAEADLKQELIPLEGGSSVVPWAAAPGRAAGEITLPIRQYDKQILRFFKPWISGSEVEDTDGESGGSVTTIINAQGTSLVDATTGVASIAVDSATAADLAIGNYKIVATGAATVDIYVDTDATGKVEYQDSDLKINDTAITIPGTGGTVVYQGIEFTGGSGSIALTTGDVATFSVNPISTYLLDSYFGKTGACSREFELTIYSECVGGRIRQVTYPRCIASASTPITMLENEWASMEVTIQVLQPSTVDYVAASKYINR
jgi:hypothetical protein